jgi:hypothetical protein
LEKEEKMESQLADLNHKTMKNLLIPTKYIFTATLTLLLLTTELSLSQSSSDREWCRMNPWLCNGHLPGFPGSNSPAVLREVIITQQRKDPWWPFGFPATPPPPGWVYISPSSSTNNTKPCAGDPVKNPTLAPSRPGNYKGGTFGYTRISETGDPKFHDGIDITAVPGTDIFSMYDGEITALQNSFAAGDYRKNSYGNYVEIRSTVNGQVVYLKFNHLDETAASLSVGVTISQGNLIGKSGTTGNASRPGIIPHLHIQAKDTNRNKTDPQPLFATKLDPETGKGTNPCN